MNKNYLILLIIIFAIIIYNCCSSKNVSKNKKVKENMAVLSGDIYLTGDKVFDPKLSVKKIKQLPNIEESVVNNIRDKHQEDENKDEIDEETIADNMNVKNIKPSWEGKILSLPKIANLLKRKLRECGVTNLDIGPNDVVGIRNRKRFLQLLPIFRKDIRDKINYDQVKCFIAKYQPENYMVFSKTEKMIPKYMPYKNILLVNQYLYQFTPYGVLKYQVPVESYVDEKATVITASLEATVIDDIHRYNDANFTIIPLKGKLYQIKNNKFFDIRTGEKIDVLAMMKEMKESLLEQDELDIKNKINKENDILLSADEADSPYYEEYVSYKEKYLKLKQDVADQEGVQSEETSTKIVKNLYEDQEQETEIDEIKENVVKLPEKFFKEILYVINHDDLIYTIKPKIVTPNFGPMKKVNEMIKNNDIVLRGILPHFYQGDDGKFHIEYLFLCNSNFYFIFKEGNVSELMDFNKKYGFNFSKTLKYELSCQEHRVILDQLVSSNKISSGRKNMILNRLKCFEDEKED